MILLRPRTLKFSSGNRHPTVKVTRAERAANVSAREELVRALEPLFEDIFDAFRLDVDDEIRRRLASSGVIGAPATSLASLEGTLGVQLADVLAQAMQAGAQVGLRFSGIEGISVSPEVAQRAAARFIRTQGSTQIAQINTETRRSIRRILGRVRSDAISPENAAQRISRQVGLTTRQARSLELFEEGLIRQRIPTPEADVQRVRETIAQDVENARQRMVRDRSRLIVENEVQLGVQEGERLFWEEAIKAGETRPDLLLKRWFTVQDERVCPICAPLHGQIVAFDASFSSLGFLGLSPPAHLRCRCFLEYAPTGEFASSRAGG